MPCRDTKNSRDLIPLLATMLNSVELSLNGSRTKYIILTNQFMKVGLLGEKLQVYTEDGSSKVQWSTYKSSSQPLTWYKVSRSFMLLI